jgi:predicted NUDIX family NTP pyrophosphohydrolase
MSKRSAGIIAFRRNANEEQQVLLVHPGGPFFRNKDAGVWSIPKGEYEEGEDPLTVAKREFKEETGNEIAGEAFIELTPVKIKSGKVIYAWAIEAEFEECFISSNAFEMEWPPRSGKKQSFPEVDKAAWFTIDEARIKMNAGQLALLNQLQVKLA